MNLGELLSGSPGEPILGRAVTLRLVRKGADGKPVRTPPLSAVLVFVGEPERRASKRAAAEYLAKEWPAAPQDEREHEENIQFLAHALRDPDDLSRAFVSGEMLPFFRAGLIPRVVNALMLEYADFVRLEYPEAITPEERKALEEQAEKNSEAGRR